MFSLNDILSTEIIKCTSCSNFMCEEIYVCFTGHSVCSRCSIEKECCTVCMTDISSTRNFALENVAQLLEHTCDNNKYGCMEKLKFDAIQDHIKYCSYRQYNCKLGKNCDWEGRLKDLKLHALGYHNGEVSPSEKFEFSWDINESPNAGSVTLFAMGDQLFYFHRQVDDENIFFWMELLGNSEDTILYGFQLEIFSTEFKYRSMSFKENCHDDTKEVSEVITSGYCVVIPRILIETYKNSNGSVWYTLRIYMI